MPRKISKRRLKKIEKLACNIVDDWDTDTLFDYAVDKMINSLSSLTKKEFDKEWDDYYQT